MSYGLGARNHITTSERPNFSIEKVLRVFEKLNFEVEFNFGKLLGWRKEFLTKFRYFITEIFFFFISIKKIHEKLTFGIVYGREKHEPRRRLK